MAIIFVVANRIPLRLVRQYFRQFSGATGDIACCTVSIVFANAIVFTIYSFFHKELSETSE
jgi:hypothetical protein